MPPAWISAAVKNWCSSLTGAGVMSSDGVTKWQGGPSLCGHVSCFTAPWALRGQRCRKEDGRAGVPSMGVACTKAQRV